jgi:cutinase
MGFEIRNKTRAAIGAAATVAAVAAGAITLSATGADAASPCSDVEVIAARGTGEPGRLGSIVGDPFARAVTQALSGEQVTSYAVDYPANWLLNYRAGSQDIIEHTSEQSAACPDQEFVLVGYSQGAMATQSALSSLPDDVDAKVRAVVLFGNPFLRTPLAREYQDRTMNFCANGDPFCDGGFNMLAHLSYGSNVGEGAAFVASQS